MSGRLNGKVAIVTGGGQGIGQGIAQAFADEGAKLVITGRTPDKLEATVAAIAASGGKAAWIAGTAGDRADAEAAVAKAVELFGGVDVLVNNAGVGFLAPTTEATFEQWDWVLDINLTGVFNGIRTFLPRMLAAGRPGHIVSTASIGGLLGAPGSTYAAAKAGVVGLMEALATELVDTPVNVSILTPGIVRTNIHNGPPPPGEALAHTPGGGAEADLHAAAMQPREVGDRVVRAILDEQLYVITHAEHRELLERRFDVILGCVPDEQPDPRRAGVERMILANPVYDRALGRAAQ